MLGHKNLSASHRDAVFIGWVRPRVGEPIPLYNVTVKNHPSYGSTVSDKTLQKLHLQVPRTPPCPKERNDNESAEAQESSISKGTKGIYRRGIHEYGHQRAAR